jgi:hypothetical protein
METTIAAIHALIKAMLETLSTIYLVAGLISVGNKRDMPFVFVAECRRTLTWTNPIVCYYLIEFRTGN